MVERPGTVRSSHCHSRPDSAGEDRRGVPSSREGRRAEEPATAARAENDGCLMMSVDEGQRAVRVEEGVLAAAQSGVQESTSLPGACPGVLSVCGPCWDRGRATGRWRIWIWPEACRSCLNRLKI